MLDDSITPQIAADDAVVRVAAGAYLIDVREQDEWNGAHAPTAHLIPLSEFQARIDEVPTDVPVLVMCHSGMRSQRVTDYLVSEGYDATNVEGGIIAWNRAGGEIESATPESPRA